jgi:hypothetical protein
MQELLKQLDPEYSRSVLLLVARTGLERLGQGRSTCAGVKSRSKLPSASIRGQRIRFKGLDGGSEVADRVLQREVRSRFGVLPRTKPATVTAMELTSYVCSRALDAERLSLPLSGQIPA